MATRAGCSAGASAIRCLAESAVAGRSCSVHARHGDAAEAIGGFRVQISIESRSCAPILRR